MVTSVQALERALPAIAGMIAGRTHVEVRWSERAWTDGNIVYMPKLPALSLTERDFVRAVAFQYHECGHITDSDFGIAYKPGLEKALCGVLEDIRIEAKQIRRFPGAANYLNRMVGTFVEEGQKAGKGFPAFDESATEVKLLQFYMLYRLRYEVLKQDLVLPVLEPTAEAAKKKFPAGMMVRLNALMFEVRNCESESEVVDLSREIVKMIEEEKQKEEEVKQQPQQPQQQSESQQNSEDDDPAETTGGQQTEDGGPQDGEGGQSEADNQPGGDDSSANESGSGDLANLLNMDDSDVIEGVGDLLKSALTDSANEAARSGAVLSMPNVHKLPLRNGQVDIAKHRGAINAIRTKTLQWMSSVAEEDTGHTMAGTLMDHTRLFQIRMGGPVFIRKEEGIDLNAAIEIVIDRSGSMCGDIQTAAQAALSASLAFDTPGISTQVSVFPAYGSTPDGSYDEGVAIIKTWDETANNLAGRISSLTTDGGTPMAEAVLFAATDVLRREETLRMVLVVTDGDPDNLELTKQAIEAARKSGVVVTGLGIGVDPSRVFGEKYSSMLGDISMLSGAIVKLVRSTLSA